MKHTQTNQLIRQDVEVGVLGLGGVALAGLYEPVDHDQAVDTVRAALDQGVRYLDVAPFYGTGLAELRYGDALREADRSRFTLSTKVGRRLEKLPDGRHREPDAMFAGSTPYTFTWDWSRDGLKRGLEGSLERLGTDHVDIVYCHDCDFYEKEESTTFDDRTAHEVFETLDDLRAQGLLKAIGFGLNMDDFLLRMVRNLDLDVILCAGRYTLLEQPAARELLPLCEERDVSVVVGGPYNSGLLADPENAHYEYDDAPEDKVARARELAGICAFHNVPLQAAALQYPLRHHQIASVLVGCKSTRELTDNLDYFNTEIPDEAWSDLDSFHTENP
ncbi:aldo/keto reductase [Streptomyces sp. NPDC050264]|uniref:aldo/keto reductase n=1 Tax=Streptomyces sp. NPDC050264 TaxID=3155038 RepID=UPI00342991DB